MLKWESLGFPLRPLGTALIFQFWNIHFSGSWVGRWVIKLTWRHFYFLISSPLLLIILRVIPKLFTSLPVKMINVRSDKKIFCFQVQRVKSDSQTEFWHIPGQFNTKKQMEPGGTLTAPCACLNHGSDTTY